MGGGKGVVDVNLPEFGKLRREGAVICFLAGIETEIFKQEHLPLDSFFVSASTSGPTQSGRGMTSVPGVPPAFQRQDSAKSRIGAPGRSSQMRHDHRYALAFQNSPKGRGESAQGGARPRSFGPFQWNVQVGSIKTRLLVRSKSFSCFIPRYYNRSHLAITGAEPYLTRSFRFASP